MMLATKCKIIHWLNADRVAARHMRLRSGAVLGAKACHQAQFASARSLRPWRFGRDHRFAARSGSHRLLLAHIASPDASAAVGEG